MIDEYLKYIKLIKMHLLETKGEIDVEIRFDSKIDVEYEAISL